MRRLPRSAVLGSAVLIAAAWLAPPALADSGPDQGTFDQLVDRSSLVVVAMVHLAPDGAITLDIRQVLHGGSAPVTTFAPPTFAPVLVDGGVAVIAFTDPASIDFRTPTIAWQVSADGYIDPDRLQQVQGLPPTLAAMYTRFGKAMSTEAERLDAAGQGGFPVGLVLPFLLVVCALVLADRGAAWRAHPKR
ncbi:MAG: hypothetical protein ABIR11_13495 [Candidatus Limnocylindrales bacterium]